MPWDGQPPTEQAPSCPTPVLKAHRLSGQRGCCITAKPACCKARADLGIVTSRSNAGGVQNRPVVSAFGQTGHRADMASGPSLTDPVEKGLVNIDES